MKEVAIFRHQPAKFDNPAPTLQKRERAHQKHKELHPLPFANSFVGFLLSPSSYHEDKGDKANGYTCCTADVLFVSFSRYFEGGVSSVYLWDLDHGFAGVILIKKGEQPLCREQPFVRKAVHAY